MASFANPYGSGPQATRGPQKNVQPTGPDWFGASRPAASVSAPKPSAAPKTQGTPYQAYAQQGQAQSIPTQSQGTPYQAYSQPSKPALRPSSQTVTGDWQGSYAAAPASQRPPPFQMGTAQTPWGQSMDPFVERDAFVNQLNQQRMQNQVAFNSGGMTDPTAGMTPGLNYQQAMQQAGLGGGAPSMSANYGDSMISRLNQAFGGQGDPFTFANQQQPNTPYQPSQGVTPGYGTPPGKRGGVRTLDFRDRDGDGIDDRDQDGPGRPDYVSAPQPRLPPAAPNSGNEYLRNPNAALQPYAGIYAPGTDITKLPRTDTMQPNPAYRPQVTPYQQPADPYTSTTYAYPGGTWGHSPQQGQPTPSQQSPRPPTAAVTRAPTMPVVTERPGQARPIEVQLTGEERRQALIAPRRYSPEEAAQRRRISDLQKEADKIKAPKAPKYDLTNYYRNLPSGMKGNRPPQRS